MEHTGEIVRWRLNYRADKFIPREGKLTKRQQRAALKQRAATSDAQTLTVKNVPDLTWELDDILPEEDEKSGPARFLQLKTE